MNSISQFESHPDAESLNAFVEQALPEREHEQILAHLGACGRCRQVVYLAHEAATALEVNEAAASKTEMEQAAAYGTAAAMTAAPSMPAAIGPESTRLAESRPGTWFRGWRIAWIPAAALAAIIGVAVFLHVQHMRPEPNSESAVVAPQAMPPIQRKLHEPSPDTRAGEKNSQPAASPIPAKAPAAKPRTAPALALSKETLSAENAPLATPLVEAGAVRMPGVNRDEAGPRQGAQIHGNLPLQDSPLANQKAQAAIPIPQPLPPALAFRSAGAGASAAKMHGEMDNLKAAQGASVAAAPPQPAMQSGSGGSPGSTEQQSAEQATVNASFREVRQAMLPSGLSPVSIVAAKRRTLAIDRFGALFLSEDLGMHWEPVAQQWSGRAIVVRMQHGFTQAGAFDGAVAEKRADDGSNAVSSGGPVPVPKPPAIFEIVNDSHLVWVSADGKTWKIK